MSAETPAGLRAARRLLRLFGLYSESLIDDLVEVFRERSTRYGAFVNQMWFLKEVGYACLYGLKDTVTDIAQGAASTDVTLPRARHAARGLGRRPGYSLTVIVLVGIAAGTLGALAGIARAVARVPPDELADVHVIIGTDYQRGWPIAYLAVPEVEDFEARVDALDRVGVFLPAATVGIERDGRPTAVPAIFADADYFEILGPRTILGRAFSQAEGEGERGPYILLSHRLWRSAFGADAAVAGRTVQAAGRTYEILGVMAEDFHDLGRSSPTDVWLPLGEASRYFENNLDSRPFRRAFAVTRIAAADRARAAEQARLASLDLQRVYPQLNRGKGFAFQSLEGWWFGSVRNPLRVMMAGAASLLVLVLGNVGALVSVRRQERESEMTLRAALGARRGHLYGIVLIESVILAALAVAAGFASAWLMLVKVDLPTLLGLPGFAAPSVHFPVLVLCAALLPLLAVSLGAGGSPERVGERRRPAIWLLATETALAAGLLTAGGAIALDAYGIATTPTGYEAPGLLTARLDMTSARIDSTAPSERSAQRVRVAAELVDSAAALPGGRSGALIGPSVLGDARWHTWFTPEEKADQFGSWIAQRIVVTPGGLATLGIELLRGRDVQWSDDGAARPVAIVDERIADRFWPDTNAVGQRFCTASSCASPYTVVGVAEAAKHRGRASTDADVVGDVYVSYAASPAAFATLAVRQAGSSGATARDLGDLVGRIAPDAAVSDVRWMEDRLSAAEHVQRTTATIVSAYALVAALLAMVGTYGLVSIRVARHWRDIAVRMALGAGPLALARRVLVSGILPVAAGSVIGAALTLPWLPRVASAVSRAGGVGGWGWAESALVAAFLPLVAVCATALPVVRLVLLRPMEVLREER